MKTRRLFVSALLAIAGFAGLASAPARAEDKPPGRAGVGLKAAVVFPQVATELTTSWGTELEGSFRVFGHLSVFASFGYTQPKVSRTAIADPRVEGGTYEGRQTQREMTMGAGAMYRLSPATRQWNAYGGLGVRVYLLQTVTEGSAALNDFGENREQSTKVGGVAFLGGEHRFGPGSILAEAQFGDSDLGHMITGDVTTGALVFALGYRLFF